MDDVNIQAQDESGFWRTFQRTPNQPQLVTMRMREVKENFPNYRVRAVDDDGRLIDMLG